MNHEERVSELFNKEQYLETRRLGWMALNALASGIKVGMNELEANLLCEKIFTELGIEKKWHKNRIRFGRNTLLSFSDPSDTRRQLQDNDIFFIDLGPIWKNHESDVGKTFVLGNDVEMHRCQKDVEEIFYELREQWLHKKLSGAELYAAAEVSAKSRGWVLNLDLAGHRIGDFPHALWHKGSLKDFVQSPQELLWVLEVQIRHPTKEWGAFFEDILMSAEASRI